MSVLPVGFGSAAGGTPAGAVERSLRFNSADSAYLNRTPASNGNRQTWTLSFWLKLGTLSTNRSFFGAGTNGSNYFLFYLTSGDVIRCEEIVGGAATWNVVTTPVYRDPSAWYHIVMAFDSPQATSSNRIKLYVNGVQVTAFSTATYPTQNLNSSYWNATSSHNIGAAIAAGVAYGNGYLTEVNFIDGQALTPSSFGETDTNTGVWKPKAYSGTYGTNGFYLPFKTASQWSGYFDGTGDKLTSSTNAIAATGEFSVEAWVYQTARTVTSDQHIFSQYTSGATAGRWYLRFNGTTVAFTTGLGTSVSCATTVNTGTWYHVCVTRDSSNRVRVFLNGVLDGTAVISGSLDTAASVIGATQTANYWHGYISNVRAVSGEIPTAYQTASTTVGATIFTPSTSQLTAVSGTSLLTCQSSTFIDNSGLSRTITTAGDVITQQFSPFTLDVTDDHSGQGNHWIPNNLDLRTTGAGADIMVDSPTSYGTDTGVGGEVRGNYATWNPLDKDDGITSVTNGNLNVVTNGSNGSIKSTIAFPSGKWYWEVTSDTISGSGTQAVGIIPQSQPPTNNMSDSGKLGYALDVSFSDRKFENGTATSYGTYTQANGAIYMLAFDQDAGKLWYGINGTWLASGAPASGTNPSSSSIPTTTAYCAAVSDNTVSGTFTVNFGQRAFAYTAPSGFKALCTTNLPTPTIGATSTTQANDYFNTVIYTGTSASTQAVTGVGFQPDFVWVKSRSLGVGSLVYDAVRGAGSSKALQSNATDYEGLGFNVTAASSRGYISSFDSDGFTAADGTTSGQYSKANTSTYVSWNWKANGAGVTNTAGTITSTVSANTTSGFSIVTYTGTNAIGATVGHGLGVAPAMIIIKNRSSLEAWPVYHTSIGATKYLVLNTTAAEATATTPWNNTAPTSTVFTIANWNALNENGSNHVAYCFAPVAGYSAFGSYTGNGSTTDGPFVYTGFRPRWLLRKRYDPATTSDWQLIDTAREEYNPDDSPLWPNLFNAQSPDPAFYVDMLSNGFKLRGTTASTNLNASGGTYIYAAFAEHPFKYSLAR